MSSTTLEAPTLVAAVPVAVSDTEDVVLSIEGVSKHYKLWASPSLRLKYSLLSQVHRTLRTVLPTDSAPLTALARQRDALHQDFAALEKLTFQVRRGESVGIIGRNGSGKSTLLQIIAGTLRPSTGRVDVYGRIAALLELGSGFNMEYTGRENVYLNASILGLTEKETNASFDAIVDFADIGQFLDQPVKTYSSGMLLRLAFAVSINVEPDILIIDEALAVGDVFFTQKCFQRLREIRDAGATLLFVSHSMSAVQNLCSRALLLNAGRTVFDGPPEEAASRYYALAAGRPVGRAGNHGGVASEAPSAADQAVSESQVAAVLKENLLPQARSRHGSRRLELVSARFETKLGSNCLQIEMLGEGTFTLLAQAHADIECPHLGFNLYDRMNNLVFAAGNAQLQVSLPSMKQGDRLLFRFSLRFSVQPGPYTCTLMASEKGAEGPDAGMFYDVHEGLGPFDVYQPDPEATMPFYGIAQLPMNILPWSYLPVEQKN
jgi:lipopolysaccharide transport system ATP-binding protein